MKATRSQLEDIAALEAWIERCRAVVDAAEAGQVLDIPTGEPHGLAQRCAAVCKVAGTTRHPGTMLEAADAMGRHSTQSHRAGPMEHPALVLEPSVMLAQEAIHLILTGRKTTDPAGIANWTRAEYPAKVAEMMGMDKRTLMRDRAIKHQQVNPPRGRLYRFDFDAIARLNPAAAEKLDPENGA